MSHSQLRERLALLAELGQIVAAMKNLAYVELRRVTRLQEAQAAAQAAMQQALGLAGLVAGKEREKTDIWLAIGSENGFCGGFNEQLAEAALALAQQQPKARWLVAGNRLQQLLAEALPGAQPLPGAGTSEALSECLELWTAHLGELLTAASDQAQALPTPLPKIGLLFHRQLPGGEPAIAQLPLLPSLTAGEARAQLLLPQTQLHTSLLLDQLRIQLLGAGLNSLLQENRARLAQMQRAQDHLDEAEQTLQRRYFRERQADITAELQTLMASLDNGARFSLRPSAPAPSGTAHDQPAQ